MSYIRFGLMILTSTLVMFALMYLNTYAWEHLFFSETRAYMAVVMGATMAVIMLAFMLGMYGNRTLNIAIFAGAIAAFALFLWLVRSQVTVSGPSYMRAMIPHHSIAVMTSERAQIEDARVRKLADEIIAAQRREIAEMRYLIADVGAGNVVDDIYEDAPPETGTVDNAVDRALVAALDPAPLEAEQAGEVVELGEDACRFHRSPESDPILWATAEGDAGAMLLNNVIVPLEGDGQQFSAEGASMTVRELGDEADWRSDAELVFDMEEGPRVGYRGFWSCGASPE
ncbi:DUF305 domain-containing protein [Histidinibacterium aquaticum]|uniref:DUF305 domain-containing protein n=1 Tax=Histidinibacterium aquaticum TaxID=2613962 RepID=A0A5J5GJ36_9RHOB|nr:DUF305 domain-containing protein [Histidinibacterium aquaticum]KAA9008259.1 DUF305 domain-containing protein [Histidinibacterium aquaticum]